MRGIPKTGKSLSMHKIIKGFMVQSYLTIFFDKWGSLRGAIQFAKDIGNAGKLHPDLVILDPIHIYCLRGKKIRLIA